MISDASASEIFLFSSLFPLLSSLFYPSRDDQTQYRHREHDRTQRVDFRRQTRLDLRVDLDRERVHRYARYENADDHVVEAHRKRQEHPRKDRRGEHRQSDREKRRQPARTEIARRFNRGIVEVFQTRRHFRVDVRNAERRVRNNERQHPERKAEQREERQKDHPKDDFRDNQRQKRQFFDPLLQRKIRFRHPQCRRGCNDCRQYRRGHAEKDGVSEGFENRVVAEQLRVPFSILGAFQKFWGLFV